MIKTTGKVIITVDFDAIRAYALKESKDNGGLESSSGMTPENLDEAWDGLRNTLPESEKDFVDVMSEIVNILGQAHGKYAEGDYDDDEDDEEDPETEGEGD